MATTVGTTVGGQVGLMGDIPNRYPTTEGMEAMVATIQVKLCGMSYFF